MSETHNEAEDGWWGTLLRQIAPLQQREAPLQQRENPARST
jgi:hypothetical protein